MSSVKIDRSKKFDQFFDCISSPRKIDFLVLHHVEANSTQHAINQFISHGVSSHFLIDELGNIFELVDENDIAYHAGTSFWNGVDGLNKYSIGIEFINSAPFEKKFAKVQMESGVKLCQYLIKKYNIKSQNVVGHSDIAYYKETGFLDRKQDPSHLFDWKFLARNGVGHSFSIDYLEKNDEVLAKFGDESSQILEIKKSLFKFGYKVLNFDSKFDLELSSLTKVFNRRFNQDKFNTEPNLWFKSSQLTLEKLNYKLTQVI